MFHNMKNSLLKAFLWWIWGRTGRKLSFSIAELRAAHFSFSQFGEDLRIADYLESLKPNDGFYLDAEHW